uniref:Interleukin-12 subunit beta n=1 Tax=Spermophilus dauricus TaxID=99837 RepID=A0A8C9URC2_SPEDA
MCLRQLVISWVSLVLLASPLLAIWELEKNVYVVELDWHPDTPGETVVLTCDTPEEDGITWTSGQSSEVLGSGKTLTILVKEFEDAGRYTCHRGGEVLSQMLLLLHKNEDGIWSTDILKKKEPENKNFVTCEAKNYSGRFTCWWLTAISTDVKFSVKSHRGSSDPQGVTCGEATLSAERVKIEQREYKKYSVQCQEDSACPTAEETLPITVVVDAVHKLKYENYVSSFFIRDISEFAWFSVLHKERCHLSHDGQGSPLYLNIGFLFFSNPEPENKNFVTCEAKNYSGRFTCWWLTAISTDVKFSVKSHRGYGSLCISCMGFKSFGNI